VHPFSGLVAGGGFGFACITASTQWLARLLCSNREWGLRPGTRATCLTWRIWKMGTGRITQMGDIQQTTLT